MSKEKDIFSENKPQYQKLNTDLFYKMIISDDSGMQVLGCRILEGFLPELSKTIDASIYTNPDILKQIKELGFDPKKAKIIYATYKIAKFKTQLL